MLAQNIMKLLQKYGVNFLNGLGTTLLLALISVSIGCRHRLRWSPSCALANRRCFASDRDGVYTEVIRDTPLLLQLYFFYFLLPDILPALKLSKFACITIALVINSGAYMSEVFRSGIQSIDRGQTEAARSLGLSARQTMMRIILPQAFKNVLPAMCNEFVAVTKETSLASTFYVGDLMTQYQTISGKTYLVIEPLVIIGVIYFVVTFSMSKLITVLERRLKNDD
ncbi:MAG: amino acid ABC transporter permease [Christensenellales bacterium]